TGYEDGDGSGGGNQRHHYIFPFVLPIKYFVAIGIRKRTGGWDFGKCLPQVRDDRLCFRWIDPYTDELSTVEHGRCAIGIGEMNQGLNAAVERPVVEILRHANNRTGFGCFALCMDGLT